MIIGFLLSININVFAQEESIEESFKRSEHLIRKSELPECKNLIKIHDSGKYAFHKYAHIAQLCFVAMAQEIGGK